MIPKTIHYCWFGHNPKPQLVVNCMKSWKKYCSDYQLVEWNEESFDIANAPVYVQQAYDAKKWAFVTDYVRLYALYSFGGVYMDTDVEVIKKLDDFLQLKGFSGFEDTQNVPTGIMAAEKGMPLIKNWLEEYDTKQFLLPDGTLNTETNVITITRNMKDRGLQLDNTLQIISDFSFFPKEFFCPKSYSDGKIYKTKNTHTIHHFAGSWLSEEERKHHKREVIISRREKRTRPIKNLVKRIVGDSVYTRIKNIIKHAPKEEGYK